MWPMFCALHARIIHVTCSEKGEEVDTLHPGPDTAVDEEVPAHTAVGDDSADSGTGGPENSPVSETEAPARGVALTASTQCRDLGNGRLCVTALKNWLGTWTGIRVTYAKYAGEPIIARFHFRDTKTGAEGWDQGWFGQNSGDTRSFDWQYKWESGKNCVMGYMDVQGQGTFDTQNPVCK
jgi:hypothetical protein